VLALLLVVASAPRVLLVPGALDGPVRERVEVVDDAATAAALGLVNDAGCARGEAACLARLAVVAEVDACVVVVDVDGDVVNAVVVTAAAERRRVQSSRAQFGDDLARALTPPAAARLHVRGAFDAVFVDDHAVAVAAAAADSGAVDVDVTPGEHRVRAARAAHSDAVVVVDVAAGEALRVAATPAPLPVQAATPTSSTPDATVATSTTGTSDTAANTTSTTKTNNPTNPTSTTKPKPTNATTTTSTTAPALSPVWPLGLAAVGIGGVIAGGVLGGAAAGTVSDAEGAVFQSERARLARDANAQIAGAAVAFVVGGAALAGAAVWLLMPQGG
jgi:hypothetical protein